MAKPRHARFALPILLAASTALLGLAGLYLWLLGSPPAPPAVGGPFRLSQTDGQTVTDRDFRGRYLLLYFGYAACPDICRTTLGTVADALRLLPGRTSQLQSVFVTVDPARDTTADAQRFAHAFSPAIRGLSGTSEQIAALTRAYRIQVQTGDVGMIDHTAVLLLMGPDGRFLAALPAAISGAQLAADLARYVPCPNPKSCGAPLMPS